MYRTRIVALEDCAVVHTRPGETASWIAYETPEDSSGWDAMPNEVRVKIASHADVVAARQEARALAIEAGFSLCDSTLITTAISEMSRNVLEYAQTGEVTISLLRNGTKSGVKIVGISDAYAAIYAKAPAMVDTFTQRWSVGEETNSEWRSPLPQLLNTFAMNPIDSCRRADG